MSFLPGFLAVLKVWLFFRKWGDKTLTPDTASFMCRVENDLVPAHVKNIFTRCSDIPAHNTKAANAGNYVTTKVRTEKEKQGFKQTGPKVWNELPDCAIESFLEKNKKNYFR